MNMRSLIRIVEGASHAYPLWSIDPEPIIAKMAKAVASTSYWDDHAVAAYPNKNFGGDDAHDMASTWDLEVGTEQFEARVQDWARARFNEVREKLSQIPLTPSGYRLHRVMRVPGDWLSKAKASGHTSLGIHWTYDLNGWDAEVGAYPVWADKIDASVDILIDAFVRPDHVDWTYTILSNMDWMSGDREFEMRVRKGAPIQVTSIATYDDGEHLGPIRGIVFTA